MFAAQADGCEVRTVEGLSAGTELNGLQQKFQDHFALQCGFCTPGILMTLTAALEDNKWPATEEEARDLLSGNFCRCTGYQSILDAIMDVKP